MADETIDVDAFVRTFNDNVDQITAVFGRGTDDFHRAYLILVAGFLKKTRALELGKKMVKAVPREYILTVLPKQMADDDLFAITMCKLAEMFRAASMVEPPTYAAPRYLILPRANA